MVLVHFASFALLTVAGAFAMALEGQIQWAIAILIFPMQFVWLIVDVIRGTGYVDGEERDAT